MSSGLLRHFADLITESQAQVVGPFKLTAVDHGTATVVGPVSYTHLTLPTNREV